MYTLRVLLGGILLILMLALSVSYVLGCETACYNGDDDPFCSPSDETCVYDTCSEIADSDSDSDGWSDVCDAFPNDDTEWVDLDADGCGHNEDANDFLAGDDCSEEIIIDDDTGDNETSDNETDDTPVKKSSGHSGGSWDRCEPEWQCVSDCDAMTITCVDPTGCGINKPTEPECPEEVILPAVIPPAVVIEPPVEPIAPAAPVIPAYNPSPAIGNAVRDIPSIGSPAWFVAALALIPFFPWRKCQVCLTRNGLFREHCAECNGKLVEVNRGTILSGLKHLPFLMFK